MPSKKTSAATAKRPATTKAKVMDVAKPGRTAPANTSRPLIVGHGPMVQDPMMSKPATNADEGETKITVNRGAKTIAPIEPAAEAPAEAAVVVATSEPQPDPVPDPPAEPEQQPDEPEAASAGTPEATPKSDEAGVVDAVAEQADTKKQPAISEAERQKQEEVQKLVDDKKYVVTVGQVTKKRRTRGAVIFLVLLLIILAAGWYVVDAEYVDPGFDLPVDIIKV